ncbi:MAG TPA: DUF1549 domain-containing protein [Verrucomicrobiae bacterium]|nr:DUF1549 domain-containing protein [Verrucomicrobiae bacterium]
MRFSRAKRFSGFGVACLALWAAAAGAETVSFRNDVMAVISKAGCNAGTCHGNANGKAGFKLSLRGEDPQFDFLALTRDLFGRRTNPFDPDQSLILVKATAQVAHEGGVRFRKDSAEYGILRAWISGGLDNDARKAPGVQRLEVTPGEAILLEPTNQVRLSVKAAFSDGTRRDVSSLAVYEPSSQMVKVDATGLVTANKAGEVTVIVRYLERQEPVRLAFVAARPDFVWSQPRARNMVDEHVFAKLRSLRMNPSELCTDSEFVRRAHLDVIGILPTADDARAFVADKRKDKRAQLIDRLLERPEFADFWALKWADLLRNEEKVLDRKGVQLFHRWIRQSIADDKPLDQFVREILTARGSTYDQPAGNYLRALRDPITRAESTAQVFLGTRLQCAKCHNHPFDRWTQNDYYDWAEVFSPVQYKVLENNRRDNLDKHEFVGEQILWAGNEKPVTNPRTSKPAKTRFLGETESGRSEQLAAWITQNPIFARSQVNRIWFQLMGRGIVDPIDDFRPTNPPSNPALLGALAEEFARGKFHLRPIIRLIMNSRTYQLSSVPNETNRDDESNFARANIQRLSAEQLLDAQSQVTGVPVQFTGYPVGMRATQLPGVRAVRTRERKPSDEDQFLTTFGKPMRLLTCECERSSETSMGQAFHLISGPTINDFLTADDNRLARLLAGKTSDAVIVDELYWSALSRSPSKDELAKATTLLGKTTDRRAALEDLTWALLNAKEFVLRK